ncbi:hypothetical protein [Pseudoalteromonas luteoviolacea]|uniref:Uncharacterized protein n=1 Tax=Pseudoalteromonas luteoviolacea S4054 TaxID=1129367 RepID=A0A0F6A7M5_9GAMM|nr:hypothetical protein [Pseudoalteromonas luteoviolacea]AOT10452.1 hypothetical protein S4054249_21520 [Pseudoalteromonas luteoviolacea]AOT15479.1 hypothetical protein S40542_22075 [Pseudoalteromonas luteoviolacea]AOT20271.1 hypothetical protein S4054_21435 [Pseudoalteromonas luteoviolacea]KKE81394.1 hypothetical protein N479_02630 [Pseudoalteromonas luteoviolacea S4054]KZN71708.1 hypothetical protein N481_18745 [Pseudoalteromonas luteoviolacea S4047-1]
MKFTKVALILATLSATSAVYADSGLGVSITEKPRPGVPQARWTYIDITDSYGQNGIAKFNYSISNYNINFDWITNNGLVGGCNIYYDVNKDSSNAWDDQVARRRYDTTKLILSNLKQGDRLFVQSAFGQNSAPCEVTVSHKIGL